MTGRDQQDAAGARLTIAGFQALIRDRYFSADAARGAAGTFMWFIEEVGELATALHRCDPARHPTQADRTNLEEEFADVLAWLTTLANVSGVDLTRAAAKYTTPGRIEGVKDGPSAADGSGGSAGSGGSGGGA